MSKRRFKLLYVISQLSQGGSERFLFELCKALDRSRFEIAILTPASLPTTDHYYGRLTALGIPIHRKLRARRYFRRVPFLGRWPAIKKLSDAVYNRRTEWEIGRLFEQQDVINIIQIENYYNLQSVFKNNNRLLIFLMSHRFQYRFDPYAECLPEREYRFVVVHPSQQNEIQGSNCGHAETRYFPLAMDFREREPILLPPANSGIVHIGVFSRLSPERPIEPFLYSFQSLLQHVDAILHIYGRGDTTGLMPTLDLLHLREKVIFAGHQLDVEAALKRDCISLVWMISHNAFLGYGTIEVASFGIPVVLWNVHTARPEQVLAETDGALHAFGTVTDFVEYNRHILENRDLLADLGRTIRAYILSAYDIRKHIAGLEAYYEDLVQRIDS